MLQTPLILMYLLRNQHWCALQKTDSLTSNVNVENDRHLTQSIQSISDSNASDVLFHQKKVSMFYILIFIICILN